jgi:hypothetical protein
MADIQIKIMHPTDGRIVDVNVDETITAEETIAQLISNSFIPANPQGYLLAIKGGNEFSPGQTLRDGGAATGTVLRVVPATDAGEPR